MKMKVIIRTFLILSLTFVAYHSRGQNNDDFLGEQVSFDVQFGIFKIGEGILNVKPEFVYPDGESPYFFVSFEIESAGLISFLYPDLHLNYESYLSRDSLLPLKTKIKMDYKNPIDQIDQFYYEDSIYVEKQDFLKERIKKLSFAHQEDLRRDILGTYLFIRSSDLSNISEERNFEFFLGSEFNDFYIYPKTGTNRVNGKTVKKHPILIPKVKDLPENRKSYIWLTDDNRPVKVSMGTRFGNIYLNVHRNKN